MKRSFCLSALLVGTSVCWGSMAFADASEAAKAPAKAPKLVAQADPASPTEPAPATAPAAPAPETAPAAPAGAETAPQPALTLGGSTSPGTDQPQAAAPDAAKKPKPRPWAGSSIYLTNSMTTGTVFKGQTQDYNPTAEAAVWLLPRYAINEAFQVRARAILNYEYTNSDTTLKRNEPQFSDTSFSLFYRKIPAFATIKPMVAVNLGLPTSRVSQARTVVVSPGATLQLSKTFEHVLGGELMLLSSAIYSHPLYRSKNPEVSDPRAPGALQCLGGNACQDLLSGTLNPSDSLAYTFLVAGEWGKWSPALYYLGASQWVYSPTEVSFQGRPVGGLTDPSRVRQTSYFSAWLDYNANSWLTAEVGYWLSRSILAEDGKYGNPFFDRYQDMRVYLGASIQLDNLLKQIEGEEGDAGIVRAQNRKSPIWNF